MTILRRVTVEPLDDLPPLRPPQPSMRLPYFPETLTLLVLGFGIFAVLHTLAQCETVRLVLEALR